MGTDFSNSAGVTAFLGSATGGGFLKTATDALNSLQDPTSGLLKGAESGLKTRLATSSTGSLPSRTRWINSRRR
jgi:hypothetical protein